MTRSSADSVAFGVMETVSTDCDVFLVLSFDTTLKWYTLEGVRPDITTRWL